MFIKYLKNIGLFLVFLSFPLTSMASVRKAAKIYIKSRGAPKYYAAIASQLVREGIYYAAIPFLKDYLITQTEKGEVSRIDKVIDKIIFEVGVKQFELLPIKVLKSSNSPMMRFIRAKKYFRAGKYQSALNTIAKKIPEKHPIKPFALLLEGSILSILNRHKEAMLVYEQCVDTSRSVISDTKDFNRKKQLEINRDYCIIGKPRSLFANKKFDKANFTYLDLTKDSYIWPEILFEEAWNSFYLKDFNRTLGKLVTYKAPVLDHVFNPEINVLNALAYMELCLWGDAKNEVDKFYETYKDDARTLKDFIKRHTKDYKYYYKLARLREKGEVQGTKLLNILLNSIIYDPTYNELLDFFIRGKNEIVYLKKLRLGKFKRVVMRNVRDSLILQRDLVGRYVRKILILRYGQLFDAFEGMSYIKLEVLSRKKKQLYRWGDDKSRSRGDIKYVKRTDKQYFWTFNGEFWADELGDYVFALKSECSSEV